MTLDFVNSSAICAVGYDGNNLYVQFHTSATIYTHYGVPYYVYVAFMNSASMGAFYNVFIRGKYR